MDYKKFERKPEKIEAYQWCGAFDDVVKCFDEKKAAYNLHCGCPRAYRLHGMMFGQIANHPEKGTSVCFGDYVGYYFGGGEA
jgi:hypothetical protein